MHVARVRLAWAHLERTWSAPGAHLDRSRCVQGAFKVRPSPFKVRRSSPKVRSSSLKVRSSSPKVRPCPLMSGGWCGTCSRTSGTGTRRSLKKRRIADYERFKSWGFHSFVGRVATGQNVRIWRNLMMIFRNFEMRHFEIKDSLKF